MGCVSEGLSEGLALLLALTSFPLHYVPDGAPFFFVARDKRVFLGWYSWGLVFFFHGVVCTVKCT